MQDKKYLIIPRSKNLTEYINRGFGSFILPLESFSIGYDAYFNIDEINELSDKNTIYVLVNKFLHRRIDEFRKLYPKFKKSIKFMIEDIGLTDVISKDRLILYENHIESNYVSINFLNLLGYKDIVLNNDLTINEINEIRDKTDSKLYFFLITRNMLLYSRRKLISNYQENYQIDKKDKRYIILEKISNIQLEINEEDDSSTIRMRKIFSGNKYIEDLEKLDYLIIDTNYMSDLELKVTLEHYNSADLVKILDTDYYFLENEIKYKVGDIK